MDLGRKCCWLQVSSKLPAIECDTVALDSVSPDMNIYSEKTQESLVTSSNIVSETKR